MRLYEQYDRDSSIESQPLDSIWSFLGEWSLGEMYSADFLSALLYSMFTADLTLMLSRLTVSAGLEDSPVNVDFFRNNPRKFPGPRAPFRVTPIKENRHAI